MRSKALRNVFSFVLVLVLTVFAIYGLSIVTRISDRDAVKDNIAAVEVAETTHLEDSNTRASAVVYENKDFSFIALLVFVLIILVLAVGLYFYMRAKKKNPHRTFKGRRYNPREELVFSTATQPTRRNRR